jgi:branched-chain amino acid transport system ATP-binding protein
MAASLLSFQQIVASYGAIKALKGVSLDVYEKEIVTLIGANGAGKSTLLMSLFGLPPISSGKILFKGNPVHHLKTHEIAALGVAIAPEGRRIFPKMLTEENLLLGGPLQNLPKIYDLFPILKQRRKQRAGTLSGGEQQMLAIGRALMSSPTLFLLDEPSLGLAPKLVHTLFEVLKEIAKSGTTILLVEQNAYHALNLADRAYVLVNGQVQLTGEAKALLKDPQIQLAYLGTPIKTP